MLRCTIRRSSQRQKSLVCLGYHCKSSQYTNSLLWVRPDHHKSLNYRFTASSSHRTNSVDLNSNVHPVDDNNNTNDYKIISKSSRKSTKKVKDKHKTRQRQKMSLSHLKPNMLSNIQFNYSLEMKKQTEVDLDLIPKLLDPAQNEHDILTSSNKIISIHNELSITPSKIEHLIQKYDNRKIPESIFAKDLAKLGSISTLILEYNQKGLINMADSWFKLPLQIGEKIDINHLIATSKKYPHIPHDQVNELVHQLSAFSNVDIQVFNILYDIHQHQINILETPFLIPLVKSVQLFLENLIQYFVSESKKSNSYPNPDALTSIINRSLDFILFTLEKVIYDIDPKNYTLNHRQDRLLGTLVLNIQTIVLKFGSPAMRYRLHELCTSIPFRGEVLSKFYSNEVLSYLGQGIQYIQSPKDSNNASNNIISNTIYNNTALNLSPGWCSSAGEINDELESALHVWMRAAANDVELTSTCNEVMVHKLLDANEVDLATQVLRTMTELKKNQNVYSRVWGHYIAIASDQMNMKALEWAWKEAISAGKVIPSDSVYYGIIETCLQHLYSGQLDSQEQESSISKMLLGSIRSLSYRSNYSDDPYLVSNAIEELASQENLRGAFRVLVLFGSNCSRIKVSDLPMLTEEIGKTREKIAHGVQACYHALSHPKTSKEAATLLFNTVCMGILKSQNQNFLPIVNQLFKHIPGSNGGINFGHLNSNHSFPTSLGNSLPSLSQKKYGPGTFVMSPDLIKPNIDTLRMLIEALVLARNPDSANLIESCYNTMVPFYIPFSRFSLALTVQGLLKLDQESRAITILESELEKYLGSEWEMKAIENETHGTQNELYLFKIMKDGLLDHAEKVRVKNLKAILDF